MTRVLSGFNLVDIARSNLLYAAALPGTIRSADAIHVATALRGKTSVLVAYAAELIAAASIAGIGTVSPAVDLLSDPPATLM